MPIMAWLHYADHALDPIRRSSSGSYVAIADIVRWSTNRKREVVLRLLRGESVDAVSRGVSVPIYKLEQWRDRPLAGIDSGLKERENDPLERHSVTPTGVLASWSWKSIS